MTKPVRLLILAAALLLAPGAVFAQSSPQSQPPAAASSAAPADLDRQPETALGKASTQAGEGHPAAAEHLLEDDGGVHVLVRQHALT